MHTWLAEEFNRPQSHLVVEDLTAGYGVTPTIVGVSLIVGKGEVVSVLGPNGAGKSTLLKALLGLLKVTQGSVTLDQLDVTNFPAEMLVRKGVGYVPQNRDVFEALTVRENLNMGGYLLGTELLKERIDEVMAIFPALTRLLKQSAGNLSGGERKMLAVGRVLMLRPTLMILDEPTANLSPEFVDDAPGGAREAARSHRLFRAAGRAEGNRRDGSVRLDVRHGLRRDQAFRCLGIAT